MNDLRVSEDALKARQQEAGDAYEHYRSAMIDLDIKQHTSRAAKEAVDTAKAKNADLRTELLKCLNDGLPKAPVISCEVAQSISDFANATVFAKKPEIGATERFLIERDALTEFRFALSDLRDRIALGSNRPNRQAAGAYISYAIHALNEEVDILYRSRKEALK